MSDYLLDTNVLGHYFNERPDVVARINDLPTDARLFISSITWWEMYFGHAITVTTDQEKRTEFERFVRNTFVDFTVPVGRHTTTHYGFLKSGIFRMHPPHSMQQNHPERCVDRVTGAELGIDENDLWIAAQAIERGLILVTNDEMLRIREVAGDLLDVEDWTQPHH